MSDTPGTSGSVGRRESAFTRSLPKRLAEFDAEALKILATQMIGNTGEVASNDPDGEENLAVPSARSAFGQFANHKKRGSDFFMDQHLSHDRKPKGYEMTGLLLSIRR